MPLYRRPHTVRVERKNKTTNTWATLISSVTGRLGAPSPTWFSAELGAMPFDALQFNCEWANTTTGTVRPQDRVVFLDSANTAMNKTTYIIHGIRGRELGKDGHLEWLLVETLELGA